MKRKIIYKKDRRHRVAQRERGECVWILHKNSKALMEWDNARITEELEIYLHHPLSDIFSVAVNICHNSR